MTRVAIAGFGAIGQVLATRLDKEVPGIDVSAVSARDILRAEGVLADLGMDVPVKPISDLEPHADIVIECAPSTLLPAIAEPFLKNGKEVIVLSSGALLENSHLIDLAEANGGTISIPTGALLGLDAVSAAAEGNLESVRITSRKPPAALKGAPGMEEAGINLDSLSEPVLVFSGSAREAAQGFPSNLNVVVALSLAGLGPDATTVEVWVDPEVTRNTHTIVVQSDSADLNMTIENVPSDNPRTGRITAQSVIALLRKRHSSLRVGS